MPFIIGRISEVAKSGALFQRWLGAAQVVVAGVMGTMVRFIIIIGEPHLQTRDAS